MAGQDQVAVCPDLTSWLNEKSVSPGSVAESVSHDVRSSRSVAVIESMYRMRIDWYDLIRFLLF